MTRDAAVDQIRALLGDRAGDVSRPSDTRLYIDLDADVLTDVVQRLTTDLDVRLQTASAVDAPQRIEILYHWAIDSLGMVITLRTYVDRDKPEIDSITPICPAAEWIEREMWELMGIAFRGHPDLRHLLLQDDWPEGQYPLRRDYRDT